MDADDLTPVNHVPTVSTKSPPHPATTVALRIMCDLPDDHLDRWQAVFDDRATAGNNLCRSVGETLRRWRAQKLPLPCTQAEFLALAFVVFGSEHVFIEARLAGEPAAGFPAL